MLSLLLLVTMLGPSVQAPTPPDAGLWTAALEQLRGGEFGRHRGELVILDETLGTSAFHELPDSTRELALLNLLRRLNDSAAKPITGVRLPPNTRLSPNVIRKPNQQGGSLSDWKFFTQEFPQAKLVRLSLPACSEDGTRAMIYYRASGGFDDAQGAYMIFEKKQGKWVVVDYLLTWIT